MDCSDKLEQAEADIAALTDPRTPAVVWARKGSPAVYVTMRIGDLHMAVSGLGFADDTTLDVAIIHWWTFEKILRRNWRRKQ